MDSVFPNFTHLLQALADAWFNNVGPEARAANIDFYFTDEFGERCSPNMDTGTMLDYLVNNTHFDEYFDWTLATGVTYDND